MSVSDATPNVSKSIHSPALTLTPNPASQTLNISLDDQPVPSYSYLVQLFDVHGRLVWEQPDLTAPFKVQIDVTSFPEGLYSCLLIGTDGYRQSGKFNIVH